MNTISIFGLGYVGCVSAACFARLGNSVVGVDVNGGKVDRINSGRSTILEEGIAELVTQVVAEGRLRATMDVAEAVAQSDVSMICVGTPSRPNGSIDLRFVERVCREIGGALQRISRRHTVVVRSTVLPGTLHDVVVPALESASGRRSGQDFGVASNPEFLREGTSIRDFDAPPFTIIGAEDQETAAVVLNLYDGIDAPTYVVPFRVAETLKYACNAFHALKVGFANEIGQFCREVNVDSHEVMRIFCADTKLNISSSYLRPGFSFGGSCLPKDLRALIHRSHQSDLAMPLLEGLLQSNRELIERTVNSVLQTRARRVAIIGLSFKPGTDDLRESPMVELVERLIGKGLRLSIYDRNVTEAGLLGANREYIEREIPHIWSLLARSASDAVLASEAVLVGHREPDFLALSPSLLRDKQVIDLVRAYPGAPSAPPNYRGIAW